MKLPLALSTLMMLSSCSSPPRPPAVDEAKRHPVNATAEVRLQTCKGELQSARILASEKTSLADSLRSRLSTQLATRSAHSASVDDVRSSVYTILFPYGATAVPLNVGEGDALTSQARDAPLIVLSGRTDGASDSPAEGRVARERAEFVRDRLIRAGVPLARIRTTWQSVGDHAADNGSPAGRSLNRRVEVEIYRVAPRHVRLDSGDAA